MGSYARQAASSRFIVEFGEDFEEKMKAPEPFFVGQFLEIGPNDMVYMYYRFERGEEMVDLMDDHAVFDPESDPEDEVVTIAEALEKDEKEIRQRFIKAGLLDDWEDE